MMCTLIVAFPTIAPATLTAQGGTIRGRTVDSTGRTLTGVIIAVDRTTLRAVSSAQGSYQVRGVDPGAYTVTARLIGYRPVSTQVNVGRDAVVEHDFTLGKTPIQLAAIDVVTGSRARHSAAEELAVPVDVYPAELIQKQGTSETSQILQAVAPSVNFPRQSVTDANDIVRPFTLRGLSPDHTLVLLNGWRRHQTALVNNFAYGMGAGSSGVDLNTIPAGALERIEVLRDGASAQYGSDAIAGVVNFVLKDGRFSPFLTVDDGQYRSANYPSDGNSLSINGGWGLGLGRGSLGLFAQILNRQPTNRAWADPFEDAITGQTDVIDPNTGKVTQKRNPVPQPNLHWGDGIEKDAMLFANFRMPLNDAGTSEIYSFGGTSQRAGNGNGYRRSAGSDRNWAQIYPMGFLPEFHPDVRDHSAVGGLRGATSGGWSYDLGASFGHNGFSYDLVNTLNASLGPCLTTACAPGADGVFGNADDPGIPNKTIFDAGRVARDEIIAGLSTAKSFQRGSSSPINFAAGAAFRRERYVIEAGELASYINGGATNQNGTAEAPGGSQVFPGFTPSDATDTHRENVGVFADVETNLNPKLLANVASRFEHYSDFGSQVTGKLAFRYQPTQRLTLRTAASTGFRAPGLSQSHFSKITTNVIGGVFEDIGIFPVDHPAAKLLGSRPLREETSVNFSGGFAASPTDNLTFTADYFHITINDRILLGATFDDATTLAILAGGGYSNIAGVQYFTNGMDTRTQGVDLASNLRLLAGSRGTFDLTADVNYAKNTITHIDPLPPELSGSSEPGLIDTVTYIGITEERPDWRATIATTYTMQRWTALARASYFGKFSSAQPGFCDLCRDRYGAKTLFDAEAGYRLNRMTLSLGIRNLFDTYPDQPSSQVVVDPSTGDRAMDYNNNFGTFPWAAASPFGYNGRYLYARAAMQLGW
jgi:iron complex outermembrane receptor protein